MRVPSSDANAKPSPGRYRRTPSRVDSNNSITPVSPGVPHGTEKQLFMQDGPSLASTLSIQPRSQSGNDPGYIAHIPQKSTDANNRGSPAHSRNGSADASQRAVAEQASRYRRRSVGAFEPGQTPGATASASAATTFSGTSYASAARPDGQSQRPMANNMHPSSAHQRQGSSESVSSGNRSRPSSAQQGSHSSIRAVTPAMSSHPRAEPQGHQNTSTRGATEIPKRVPSRSPLSNPVSVESESAARPAASAPVAKGAAGPSQAMQHLTAVSDKDANKGMKSKLRRAFSFGSAQELRKASAENLSSERLKARQVPSSRFDHQLEGEDAKVAAQQEAAGIGANIYSGQGGFSGSTDNLSISSTASSASMMLRKMGHGMKKSTRSIKGLFRPKSVVGVPAADSAAAQPSTAQVSMVTVEAERENVNVNVDPHAHAGGGTGFPKLERNSVDAVSVASKPPSSQGTNANGDAWPRKSIVGSDRERAEVLAAVKKGILKRNNTTQNVTLLDTRPTEASLALPNIPHIVDSPNPSEPTTPADDYRSAQDYFNASRLTSGSTRSLPNTPHLNRNISFSPRIMFHDAWSASDYDRRGDIATCNRLTPMLAQQIKEELNTFKMEMEVHELSKPHTHFF
ncbi:hypothetical protein LTS18_010630 [Coniosporium uncinatum]|uniref:Uncharacterized protein n=1 Tax=Coniosporium uncinatum TaxID=93489 RepID=A0ACC3DZF2_9PEZI|nr:hypothetical protein LTS18_010630 [Coniosporium uncinatum]